MVLQMNNSVTGCMQNGSMAVHVEQMTADMSSSEVCSGGAILLSSGRFILLRFPRPTLALLPIRSGPGRPSVHLLKLENMGISRKIGHRLYLAFAALILLQFITILIGYRQFQSIQTLSAKVAQEQWPKTVIANQIIDNINRNGRSVLALMFLTDPRQMKLSVQQMDAASRELTLFYAQLGKTVTDADGVALLRQIKKDRLESDVPPLNNRRGPPASRPLNNASSVQQTQKSFSTFWTAVPRRAAAPRNKPLRSASLAVMTVWNAGFNGPPRV
jgi:hypothetical protein